MKANLEEHLMINKFSKLTYIKDQRKFLKSDLYIKSDGVIYILCVNMSN